MDNSKQHAMLSALRHFVRGLSLRYVMANGKIWAIYQWMTALVVVDKDNVETVYTQLMSHIADLREYDDFPEVHDILVMLVDLAEKLIPGATRAGSSAALTRAWRVAELSVTRNILKVVRFHAVHV